MFCNTKPIYKFALNMKKKNVGGRPKTYNGKTKIVAFRLMDNKQMIAAIRAHVKNKMSKYKV
ncbi:hypothetical protein UFOVP1605_52 [uncultured Caudovirales phage]|uniref:Uncharacterized protein n=1 Tax=uncultured Caudovirales phage TaxID=2100421 RepID=A0A6J5SUC7_9CAUD|nr:hypothetical protein UFOVP1605_52 [uncultured Caudovirales phage]